MSLQDIKKSKKPRTKGYFERKSDQKKAVQEYFKNKNKNKKETADRAPGSEGYKPTKTDIGPFKKVDKNFNPKPVEGPGKLTFKPSQDAKLNKSNAPMPNFTPKKVDKMDAPKKEKTMMEKAKDIIGVGREATEKEKMGRSLQDKARKSMGMKKGGKVKKHRGDGCCMKGKTKGRMV
jgi:hypothetical protein